jgi:activator of HSP90 ATPase
MRTKTIRQTVQFGVEPDEVYEALMDPKKHADLTGAKATISRKVGGRFSVWDGYAGGKNRELVPGRRIVQSWRASDWPEGVYSTVRFEFTKIKSGTRMSFTQSGIPEEFVQDIKKGWKDFYWAPMKGMLDK